MDKIKRSVYSEEFKIEAIKLVLEGGETVPEVALKLGLKPNQLYNWMQSHRLPGEIKAMISKQKELESENKKLKKELAKSQQETEILKKAVTYFAK
jgi:transposase